MVSDGWNELPVWSCLLLLASACVGSGVGVPWEEPDPDVAPTDFPEIQTMIFDPMCTPQCHSGGAAPKGLSLEWGRSLRALVNVPSVEAPDMLRVSPAHPEESYLVVKIDTSDPRRVGNRMPKNGPPYLSYVQVRAIERWIAAGATDDWVDNGAMEEDSGGGS